LADAYSKDASDARRAALRSVLGAAASLMLTAAVVVAAAVLSIKGKDGTGLNVGPFLARASACLPLLAFALALLWLAARQRRSAREALRLARQLPALPAYLSSLPPLASHLMRMTMTQRMFPRLIEDTDPLRDPPWPEATELLEAVKNTPNAT
jgi:hypothetical protein